MKNYLTMMGDWKMSNNDVTIDKIKLQRILTRVILMEKKNSNTKQYSDNEMIKEIQKAIEEEVECL